MAVLSGQKSLSEALDYKASITNTSAGVTSVPPGPVVATNDVLLGMEEPPSEQLGVLVPPVESTP